jgi:Ca2+-binding EF-hand superfamily protein
MRGRRSRVRISKPLLAACALAWPAAALAQSLTPNTPEYKDRVARFKAADKNHDGMVDRGEYHEAMLEIFYLSDKNKDGFLELDEIGVDRKPAFDAADKNHDGKLSLNEYENARYEQFVEMDTNHDGELSMSEVMAGP